MPTLYLLCVIVTPDSGTDLPGLLTRCFEDEHKACQAFEYYAVRGYNAVLSRLNVQRGELDTWLASHITGHDFSPATSVAA